MTCAREQKLRRVQLKMLRSILGRKRVIKINGDVETWVEWVQRVTAEVRGIMSDLRIPDWVDEQRSRRAGWCKRLEGMSHDRWARRVLMWEPIGYRRRGRPLVRWADFP